VACVAQRSSDQPRRWLQNYAPAGHSTSLYVRFYGVVRPPPACPTFINLSGTMRRVTLDELHALSPDAVYTPPGASRPSKLQRYAQDTSRAAEVIDPGPPWFFARRCLRPFVHLRPRPRWMPRVLGALRACKAQDSPQARPRPTFERLAAHPTMARTGTLPGAAPATPPPPSATPRAPGAPPPFPLSKAVHTGTCTLGPVPVLRL
jgi:hypothetical protein